MANARCLGGKASIQEASKPKLWWGTGFGKHVAFLKNLTVSFKSTRTIPLFPALRPPNAA